MTGQTLGDYRIGSKLGEGGMGVVYKALDTHLDRTVAIKVLRPAAVADPERKRRFVQEAKTASALNHPSIVTIYDIDNDQGVDFIAMEYVDGCTLHEWIRRGKVDLAECLRYAIQMADALARAHGAGIVHRDLKPGNIMVTGFEGRPGLVKLFDFGMARLTEAAVSDPTLETESAWMMEPPRTADGSIVGTYAYMSPEQAEGRKVDARSDVFSFGAVLYEMATGRRAFDADGRIVTLFAIVREDPQPARQIAKDVPPELETIIARCLRKDPRRRFQVMDDVRIALEDLQEATASRPALAGSRRKLRRRWLYAGAVAML